MDITSVAQTIQLILAPSVLLTTCAILLSSFEQRFAAINNRLRAVMRERLDLFRSPAGDLLSSPTPRDANTIERLAEIDAQVSALLYRHRLVRGSIVVLLCAMVDFIATMMAIGLSIVIPSPTIALVVLALLFLGTVLLLVGTASVAVDVRATHLSVHNELDRVMRLGRGPSS